VAGLGALALAVGVANPAGAQLAANPVYVSPKAPNGLTLAADFGTTLSTKVTNGGVTRTAASKPNHVGLRATLGLPVIGIGVGAGQYNYDTTGVDKEIQFSGDVGLKVFSPPLAPVGIGVNAGVGYLKTGSGTSEQKRVSIPIGIGIAVKPPSPSVSFELWAAPRVQLLAVSTSTAKGTQVGIGAGGGVNLGMPMGLGLHIAADWTSMSDKRITSGTGTLSLLETQSLVLGLGLHYTFTIPGLPVVPVI
jgi:hypothetical protein